MDSEVQPSYQTERKMTDRQYVIRAAQIKGLSIILPTKASPGILAIDWSTKNARGVYPCIVDALTWAQARTQINAAYRT